MEVARFDAIRRPLIFAVPEACLKPLERSLLLFDLLLLGLELATQLGRRGRGVRLIRHFDMHEEVA